MLHNLVVPTIYQEQHSLQQPTNAQNLDLKNKDRQVLDIVPMMFEMRTTMCIH